jgi:hypothetical protein
MPQHQIDPLIQLSPILPLVLVLVLRGRRMMQERPLELDRLWVRPALIVAAAAMALFDQPPGAPALALLGWAWLGLALLAGAVVGWHYGRAMKIEVNSHDGTLTTKGNIVALIVMAVLVLFRLGLRPVMVAQSGNTHLDVLLISDASIVFTAALVVVRSLEMYLRAMKLMAGQGAG